jgi:hypothetical protein
MYIVYLLWCESTRKLYIGQPNALLSRLRAQNKTGSPAAAANSTQKTAGGFTWMYI